MAGRRVKWFRDMREKGLRVKVALLDEKQIGFLYVMPIEICPWGPLGKDLLAVPCLFVLNEQKGKGAGSALIAEAEEEARRQGKKGLVTTGYYHDFWFMPARFFEKCGFSAVGKPREVTSEGEKEYLSKEAILWKVFDSSAEPPEFLKPKYQFEPVSGKVVVDLFFNAFCGTSNGEAQLTIPPFFGNISVPGESLSTARKSAGDTRPPGTAYAKPSLKPQAKINPERLKAKIL